MQQVILGVAFAAASLTVVGTAYRVGRWHQRAIHGKELVRRRLFSGSSNKGSASPMLVRRRAYEKLSRPEYGQYEARFRVAQGAR
jgi:hypothetical protein